MDADARQEILEGKLAVLKELLADESYAERLHPVERMIAQAALDDWRRLSCNSCLRWVCALIAKMRDEMDDFSHVMSTLEARDEDGESR